MNTGDFGTMDSTIADDEDARDKCSRKRILAPQVALMAFGYPMGHPTGAAAARQPLFVHVRQGGRITHRVHVPGRHAIACSLGGQDGRTLFCLAVAANLDDYPNRQQTARVEITTADVPGAASSVRSAEAGSH
jgi:hypothetical protein